ncbi:MAG TPA: galactokinase [Terriglobales bacterium]|nr:galactokinase [Terriglobales bacterium]
MCAAATEFGMGRLSHLKERFRALQGGEAQIYRAPGRVNLIGEHTDYNDGFVMPAAIDFYTWAAAGARPDRKIRVYSENFKQCAEMDLDNPPTRRRGHWSDYVFGVVMLLLRSGRQLRGANLLLDGQVPIGAGLSSSASVEVASGYALLDGAGLTIDGIELAKLCQRAENEFVGARCGIMDQFIACHGGQGNALLLDCRSLEYRRLPLPGDIRLVICNTMVKHDHASGEYNARREECEAGVRLLAQALPKVRALRDVTLAELEAHESLLLPRIYRRCRHVVSENQRVLDAAQALARADLAGFGKLMAESHRSLRDDYEVSCPELDLMVELASRLPGVWGSRMTGGGFGGCIINLVKRENTASFQRTLAEEYRKATGRIPEIYVTTASDGARRCEPPGSVLG